MLYPLIGIFAVLYFYLAWRDFYLALWFLILALPSYLIRFTIGFVPYTVLELMIWLLFLSWLVKNWKIFWPAAKAGLKKPSNDLVRFRAAILTFFFAATIAIFVAVDLEKAAGLWKAYYLEPIILFCLIVINVRTKKQLEGLFTALGLSVIGIFAFGVYQYFTAFKLNPIYMVSGQVDRITSIYGFPNAVGLFAGPVVVLFFGLLFDWHHQWKKFFFRLLVVICGLAAIILAKSEGALIGVIASLFVTGFVFSRTRWHAAALLAILLNVVLFFNPAYDFVREKFTFQDWSGQVRVTMWKESLEMIKHNWFWGAGMSSYPTVFAPYHKATYIEIFQYPHNIILNFWSELGLLGLCAFLWLVAEFFKIGYDAKKSRIYNVFVAALIAVMIEILIHGLVDVPYMKNDLAMLFWLILASMVVVRRLDIEDKKQAIRADFESKEV